MACPCKEQNSCCSAATATAPAECKCGDKCACQNCSVHPKEEKKTGCCKGASRI